MLWHIELKFCTWLCSNVLHIKFECRQFVSIFVGVMPLLELKILQIHSFPHFSLTCLDILSWNFAYHFVLLYYRSSSSVVNFCVSYAPFGTQNTENIQFSALFSDMLWLIELKICTWLCFTEIKINFRLSSICVIFYTSVFRRDVLWYGDVRLSGSPSVRPSGSPSVRPSVTVFRTFSPTCFEILTWNFVYNFILMHVR